MLKIYDYRVVLFSFLLGCFSFFRGFDAEFPIALDRLDFQLQNERKEGLIEFIYIFLNDLKVGALIILLGIMRGGTYWLFTLNTVMVKFSKS